MSAHSLEAVGAGAAGWLAGLPTIRLLRSEDRGLLDAFIRGLSPLSKLRRFHWPLREASPRLLDRLVDVAGPGDAALVAVLRTRGGEVAVGEARYSADAEQPDAHEFAVAVGDPFQRLGVGKRLLRELIWNAARSGVRCLYGDTFVDNEPMLELAHGLGFERRRHPADARLVRMSSTLEHWRSDMSTPSNVLSFPLRTIEPPADDRPLWSSAREVVATWLQRSRERQALAHLSSSQRCDMGLDPDAIEREISKPFWRA